MKDDKPIQNLCLHTHNIFCDGKQDINILIKNAVFQGVTQIGISSHAPIKHENKWSMELNQLENYLNKIKQAQKEYHKKIEIFKALEIDYIPKKSYAFDFFRKKMQLDYTIGSIHLVAHPQKEDLWFIDGDKQQSIAGMKQVFDGDVRFAVQQFYAQTREMITTQKPDIIGHLDKAVMNIGHLIDVASYWYQEEIRQTLQQIKKHGVIVEANTRGLYKGKWQETFPSQAILKQCFEMDIPVMINSDAHHSDELLLYYPKTRALLKTIGYRYVQGRINNKWGNFPI